MEKQDGSKHIQIRNWKGIEFLLTLNPGRVDGWGIHLDQDKVNRYLLYKHEYFN